MLGHSGRFLWIPAGCVGEDGGRAPALRSGVILARNSPWGLGDLERRRLRQLGEENRRPRRLAWRMSVPSAKVAKGLTCDAAIRYSNKLETGSLHRDRPVGFRIVRAQVAGRSSAAREKEVHDLKSDW